MDSRKHEDYARLMDAAYERAHRLRREAMAEFGAGAISWVLLALRAGWRRLHATRFLPHLTSRS